MVLGDAQDDDGETAEEDEEGSDAGGADGEQCKEYYNSQSCPYSVANYEKYESICDLLDHQLEKTDLGDLQTEKTTDSMYAMARMIVVVEEKRLCSDGCRKSLYGVLLTGAIFSLAHRRARECRVVWWKAGEGARDDVRLTGLS